MGKFYISPELPDGTIIASGPGVPEGAVTAIPGSRYSRHNGDDYYKVTGTGNTGWALKSALDTVARERLERFARRSGGRFGKLLTGDYFDQAINGTSGGSSFPPVDSLMFVPFITDRNITINQIGYNCPTAKTLAGTDAVSMGIYTVDPADEYLLTRQANVAAAITGGATVGFKSQTFAFTFQAFTEYYLCMHTDHDGNYTTIVGGNSLITNLNANNSTNYNKMFRTTQAYALTLPATFTLTSAMRVQSEQPSIRMRVG